MQTNGGNLLDLLYWFVMQQMDVRTTHFYSSEAVQILSYTSINSKVLNIIWRPFIWRRSLKNMKMDSEESCRTYLKNTWTRNWCSYEHYMETFVLMTLLKTVYKEYVLTCDRYSTVTLSHKTSNINDRVDSDFYQLQHSTCPIK